MRRIYIYILSTLILGFVSATSEPNAHDPVIKSKYKNGRGIPVIHGTIREDETTVQLDPPLTATDADEVGGARFICGYRIVSTKHNIPFVIELRDRATGAAEIKLAEGKKLNYEKRMQYKFSIVAYDCGSSWERESNRVIVMIQVEDVDEFAPKFDKPSYMVEVEEGKMFDSILKLHALDEDRSPTFKGICGYEILTPDVPFQIDHEGNLNNTEPLNYDHNINFILQVVAVDCGQKKSQPVFVSVKVSKICKSGWEGIAESIEYTPVSGRQKVAEAAHLRLCDDTCTPDKISVRMDLATRHIGKGCDRDTYSITSQRKLCGASGESVDLLPSPSLATNWTQGLPTDDGHESDQIFAFDGKTNAVEVPSGHFNHILGQHFTISTWLKHNFNEEEEGRNHGDKEHILCMADGEYMDRRHYAWYLHGEKLIFLLRQEAETIDDMEVFRPAEWRWHIPQVNDGEWHHYTVSIDFPEVRLYIDGKLLIADKTNQEILDDWPLHRTGKVHYTKLVVGACWLGVENRFDHYFHGYMAGLSILKDKTESDRVIKCLNNCKESLDFHSLNEMQSGTTVSFNNEMTEFSLTGKNVSEIEVLMQEVAYINARSYPTPGRRNLNIRTSLQCSDKNVVLPEINSYIMVQPAQRPLISLSGSTMIKATLEELKNGKMILEDVHIAVDVIIEEEKEVDKSDDDDDDDDDYYDDDDMLYNNNRQETKIQHLEYKASKIQSLQDTKPKDDVADGVLLDMCTIRANPPLDLHVEQLTLPTNLMAQFNMRLESSETNAGLVISNADKIENYEMVLRGIHFYHSNAAQLDSRQLTLSCSSQSGRFVSNDLKVQIIAIHMEPITRAHAHIQQDKAAVIQDHNPLKLQHTITVTASPNVGMVAIIVVCVGFLLFMIILGVIRIRAAHRRTSGQVVHVDEKEEMEWDNSGLNIIVNPMVTELFEYEENATQTLKDDSDSDDDGSDYHDDGESSEEEPEVKVKETGLEWDDSTLSF